MLRNLLRICRTGLRWTGRAAMSVLNLVLALLVLFEEWGWQPLVHLVGRLRQFKPWLRFEHWVEGLPSYPALIVLALPSLAIVPIKLIAVFLFAHGDFIAAALVLGAAKVVGTAFVGRLFILTKPAILRIGWVAALYNTIVPWQEAMFAYLRATWVWRMGRVVKWRVRRLAALLWRRSKGWRQAAADRLALMWAAVARLVYRSSSKPRS